MRWIMDQYLLDKHLKTSPHPDMAEAAKRQGHEVYITDMSKGFVKDIDDIPFDDKKPVVLYGSHQFVREIERRYPTFVPGAFTNLKNLQFSSYSAYYNDLMLNDDYIIVPWSEAKRRIEGDVFIRPNSVTKDFPGTAIKKKDIEHEFNAIEKISFPYAETLVVVASVKKIVSEFRFFIIDGKVITASEYEHEDKKKKKTRNDIDPECRNLADYVAQSNWQPDSAYTVDIAITPEGEAKIVEFNTFSCAGVYAADTKLIAQSMAKLSARLYKESR